ncbi:glycosyltransferase family 2 protein [Candidatus Gottesmanbacteria bacterium]|nr:glycosyltransferase family 2 protein [Candidatus Gottesmanbacteria bacterium]
MELSIIIVSFNTSSFLRKCLNNVYKSLSFCKIEKDSEIFVVDNNSIDDSVSVVEKNFPKVELIRNSRNVGFAGANNQGIRKSSGKYILLLNTDTEIKKESLNKLLDVIKKDPKVGVVGGKLLNPDGSIQPSVGYSPDVIKIFFWMMFLDDIRFLTNILKPYHVESKSFYANEENVDWVSGACFLVKREVIDTVGYLDDNIFMYGEEVEWCYRIKKAYFKIVYTPSAQIVHYKGASTKSEVAGIVDEFKAILYFYKKHKSHWQLLLVKIFLKFGALLRVLTFGIIGRYKERRSLYAKAFKLD